MRKPVVAKTFEGFGLIREQDCPRMGKAVVVGLTCPFEAAVGSWP